MASAMDADPMLPTLQDDDNIDAFDNDSKARLAVRGRRLDADDEDQFGDQENEDEGLFGSESEQEQSASVQHPMANSVN